MPITSGRKVKFAGGALAATEDILPRVSGIKYKIHSINLNVMNTAAETCYGVKVQTVGEDGQPAIYVACIVPGVANVQAVHNPDLGFMTAGGASVQLGVLGDALFPYRMYATIVYEEVSQ